MPPFLIPAAFLLAASHALAHEGQGLGAIHWHATDTAGLAFIAVVAALAFWLSRGD